MGLIARSVEAITMVLDVMRGYIAVAGGLTDISVQRARQMAELVMSRSTEAADRSSEQIQELAEDLVEQSQTNRDLLVGLIRTEVERTVGRMGFVREEELAAVRNHVQRLEAQLRALQTGATGASTVAARTLTGAAGAMASKVAPTRRPENTSGASAQTAPAVADEAAAAPAHDSTTSEPSAKPAPAKKATAKKAPAKKAPAKKAPAKKAAVTRAPAKKAPAKKATAKKATKKSAAASAPAAAEPAPTAPASAQQGSDD